MYAIYTQSHFHSSIDEDLGIVATRTRLYFGRDHNPQSFEPTFQCSELTMVPFGVRHRLMADEGDGSFQTVGSYTRGKQRNMCYGRPGEEHEMKGVRDLAWFHLDPLYGSDAPAL